MDPEFYSKIDAASEVWIYGCGLAGQWLVSQFGSRGTKVRGFIDTDEKIRQAYQRSYGSPAQGCRWPERSCEKNALVVISVIDIKDVLDLLHCFDVNINYVPLGKHITADSKEMVENSEPQHFLSYASLQ